MYETSLCEKLQHLDVHRLHAREAHKMHTRHVHKNCMEHTHGQKHEEKDSLVMLYMFFIR